MWRFRGDLWEILLRSSPDVAQIWLAPLLCWLVCLLSVSSLSPLFSLSHVCASFVSSRVSRVSHGLGPCRHWYYYYYYYYGPSVRVRVKIRDRIRVSVILDPSPHYGPDSI